MGPVSFFLGIFNIVTFSACLIFALINMASSANPDGLYLIAGLGMFLTLGLAVIGVVLGFISLFKKGQKRMFGVLGLGLNALFIFGVLFLVVLGMFGP